MVEERLVNLGYKNTRGNKWLRGKRAVHMMHSSEFGRGYVRIMWREEWKGDHAIIYDYSSGGGPVCIVPIPDLFTSDFVKKKRRKASYANSGILVVTEILRKPRVGYAGSQFQRSVGSFEIGC